MTHAPADHSAMPRRVPRSRLYEQVAEQIGRWISENGLQAGDRLPAERDLAVRLGVSRATLSQALIALEVIGAVTVRHGDGTVVTGHSFGAINKAIRDHARRLPEIIDARDALETKLAALAAERRTADDLAAIQQALDVMEADIEDGGRGVRGDEMFHAAITAAARSDLLSSMMQTISELIVETRIESLSQPGRPRDSLLGHQRITDAIVNRDPQAAADAMHAHIQRVSDVEIAR